MAFIINNQNVDLCCFIYNDKILLLKSFDRTENSCESHEIRCFQTKSNQELSEASNAREVKEHYVVSAAVSNCGNFVSACDSANFLHLWKYDNNSWNHLSERKLVRKCQKIIFTNSVSEIIIADRGGDVFQFSVVKCQEEGRFLLGHISLILDIAISCNDNYLLTCDRDGKIRVSHYPNSYNIHSYCLGHEEFVSSVQCVHLSEELIVSASGDGSVKLWNFNSDSIFSINVFENEAICKKLESCNGVISKTSLPFVLDEKRTIFAVQKIRYSPVSRLCAVSFYLIKGVAMYCLSDTKECKFVEFIDVESIPFDLFFNRTGDLIILQKDNNKPFLYFKYMKDNVHFIKVDSFNYHLFEELKKFCGTVENLYEFQDDCEALFKRNFDDKDDNSETSCTKKVKIIDPKMT